MLIIYLGNGTGPWHIVQAGLELVVFLLSPVLSVVWFEVLICLLMLSRDSVLLNQHFEGGLVGRESQVIKIRLKEVFVC